MDGWVIVALFAVFCSIGLPIFIAFVKTVLDHRQKMAAIRGGSDTAKANMDKLSTEYQEFVLGVDARMQKIEERLRLLEARLRQSGDSGENQQVRRG